MNVDEKIRATHGANAQPRTWSEKLESNPEK